MSNSNKNIFFVCVKANVMNIYADSELPVMASDELIFEYLCLQI